MTDRILLSRRPLVAATVLLLVALGAPELQAQTTFTACRVPDVGAIYMIGVSGAPSACLDPSHVEFSWTEGSGSLTAGSVTTVEIADGTIATADIGADAVTTAEILDGTIATADIAADAVTSAGIADGTVATADIAADAVTSAEIADGTVATADIAADAVTSAGIADGTVATADLASGAVTSGALASGLFQWATVQGTGTVFGSSGGISGTRVSTGVYNLDFTISLGGQANCALLGTAADGAHIVQTVHGSRYGGGQNQLRVRLYDAAGSPVDGGFVVMVICT